MTHLGTAIESSANKILPCQGFKNDITNLQTSAGTSNLKTHFLWFSKVPITYKSGDRGSTVVKMLRYKLEDHWFDPSWCQRIFH
jgi:hypothetical protein